MSLSSWRASLPVYSHIFPINPLKESPGREKIAGPATLLEAEVKVLMWQEINYLSIVVLFYLLRPLKVIKMTLGSQVMKSTQGGG